MKTGRLSSFLALLFLFASCKHYGFEENAAPDGASAGNASETWGATGGGSGACPTGGAFRCTDALLEHCDGLQPDVWTGVASCSSPELCDAEAGTCRICASESYRCENWQLRACNSAGLGWETGTACLDSQYCDSSEGRCLVCLAEEAFCSGELLYICNDSGTDWSITQCETAGECNIASLACRACVPGELQCSGATLQRCSDAFEWLPLLSCVTPALCQVTRSDAMDSGDLWAEQCHPPECEAGAYRCDPSDGRILEACVPGRTHWEQVSVCDTAGLCNATQGQCEVGCTPGRYRCDGVLLQICNATGSSFETEKTCQSEAFCNTFRQDCVQCVVGEHQCNGAELQQCTASHEWELVQTCASASLCDANGRSCSEPVCPVAGAFSCDGATLRQCAADLATWTVRDECSAEALCNESDGRCDTGCPLAGAVQCVGQALQRCAADQSAWIVEAVCDTGTICSGTTERCESSCPAVPYDCQRGVPVQCVANDTGGIQWIAIDEPCATTELCHFDTVRAFCSAPQCDPEGGENHFRCNPLNPQLLEECNAGRTGWQTARSCDLGETCDAVGSNDTGAPQCDICVPGSYECAGASLLQCSPDGQSALSVRTCRGPDFCYAAGDGSEGNCYTCAADEWQCQGLQNIAPCAADRMGFASSEYFVSCPDGCVDLPGSNDYCGACDSNSADNCLNGTARVCLDEIGIWEVSDCAAAGQLCVEGSCVSCQPGVLQCLPSDGVGARRFCSDTGMWQDASCPNICLDSGDADVCVDCGSDVDCPQLSPVCRLSTHLCVQCNPDSADAQCSGDAIESCNTATWMWEQTSCASIDPQTPACVAGSCVECSSAMPCTEAGQFCSAGQCRECNAGETSCGGPSSLLECSADGFWVDSSSCGATGCYQIAEGVAACGDCVGGTAECGADSLTRRTCDATFGTWSDYEDCALGCVDDGTADFCATCTDGEMRCEQEAAQLCASGIWTTVEECGVLGCFEIDGQPVCALCALGDVRCSPDLSAIETCSSVGQWDSMACSFGCLVDAGGPFCAECAEGEQSCFDSTTRQYCLDGSNQTEDCGLLGERCEAGACIAAGGSGGAGGGGAGGAAVGSGGAAAGSGGAAAGSG